MKLYIVLYIIFLSLLWILFLINKKKLKLKLTIVYLIYWHILFLNLALSLLFFNWKENEAWILIQTNADQYWAAFFITVFPFFIFYIKNRILKRNSIQIDMIRATLLDFIKMLFMVIAVVVINRILIINLLKWDI